MKIVTFEIANKLEEKGFKQGYNIFGYKLIFSDENTIKYISDIGAYEKEYFGINIPCPSISEVLKWLRENKEIDLAIEPQFHFGKRKGYGVRVFAPSLNKPVRCGYFDKWEEASIAGIEYTLDNLI